MGEPPDPNLYAIGAPRPDPPPDTPRPEDNASDVLPLRIEPGGHYARGFVRGLIFGLLGWSWTRDRGREDDIRGANHGLLTRWLLLALALLASTWTLGSAP